MSYRYGKINLKKRNEDDISGAVFDLLEGGEKIDLFSTQNLMQSNLNFLEGFMFNPDEDLSSATDIDLLKTIGKADWSEDFTSNEFQSLHVDQQEALSREWLRLKRELTPNYAVDEIEKRMITPSFQRKREQIAFDEQVNMIEGNPPVNEEYVNQIFENAGWSGAMSDYIKDVLRANNLLGE